MAYFIGACLICLIFGLLFMTVLMYRLHDPDWHYQFTTQNFKDKDFFTRMVKWLMS